jgi:hypothetical protein
MPVLLDEPERNGADLFKCNLFSMVSWSLTVVSSADVEAMLTPMGFDMSGFRTAARPRHR